MSAFGYNHYAPSWRPSIPPPFSQHWSTIFASNAGGKQYLTGIEAASIFLASGLDKQSLSRIWEEADSTHDGRFSQDEFVHAMWLIESQRGSATTHPQPPAPASFAPFAPPATSQFSDSNSQYSNANPPSVLEMHDALVCAGCDAGLVDSDTVHHCLSCEHGKNVRCARCGPSCAHQGQVSLRQLQPGQGIKEEDKDGDLGFSGLKCRACKVKFQVGMLVWHCRRCLEYNLCRECWPDSKKRCKHAARGKVDVRRIKRTSLNELVEDADRIHDIFSN